MYLCTLHSKFQILSVITVERKKTERENAAPNAKSCCTIMQTPAQVTDRSGLSSHEAPAPSSY